MSDIRDRYLACWNEESESARAELVATTFAPEATYVDPLAEAAGHDSIGATIAAVRQQFPGFRFSPVGEVDEHHGVARFRWGLGSEGQEPLVIGFDVVTTTDDGRVSSVVGFLDRVPAGASRGPRPLASQLREDGWSCTSRPTIFPQFAGRGTDKARTPRPDRSGRGVFGDPAGTRTRGLRRDRATR
jgi:hypothetical protein